jgi:hypothetical protein
MPRHRLNNLVRFYNAARESWLTYRGAIAANSPSDQYFRQLNRNLTDLMNAVRDLTQNEVRQ